MKKTFSLHGHFANQTVTLGGYNFINGRVTLDLANEREVELMGKFFSQWQAKEVDDGKCDLQEGAHAVPSDLEPNGEGASANRSASVSSGATGAEAGDQAGRLVSVGGGQAESVDPRITRLVAAVRSLDPGRDEDWTSAGKPALPAIERALGYAGIRRAEVEAVLPGFTRTNRT